MTSDSKNPRLDLMKIEAPKALHPDPQRWIEAIPFETTAEVATPQRLIDQVIGQDDAVSVALKAAEQKRNLLLLGDPGTGKSMIARAMAEVLPQEKLPDVLTYHNNKNPNQPKVIAVDGGEGQGLVDNYEGRAKRSAWRWRLLEWTTAGGLLAFGIWLSFFKDPPDSMLVFLFIMLIAMLFVYFMGQRRPKADLIVPKMLVNNGGAMQSAPYVEATGSQGGALLGDVRHDPFQSGGLETPPHLRVEAGAIHHAHRGVLFIDEINVLRLASQQALLTAMQERTYAISGQSQSSSGSNVRTEAVPCDFILVAAGNQDALDPPDGFDRGMHPALRSRIRGYGYEVLVNRLMDDTHANRLRLIQFVAQEVIRDGRVPHFSRAAVADLVREAQRRSGRTGKLTLRLRELGGLVRTAGDFANTEGASVVELHHVRAAKMAARSMEQQMTDAEIREQLADHWVEAKGTGIGRALGAAVVGTGEVGEPAGVLVPLEAAVVPATGRHGGTLVLGHTLASRGHHGINNVGALLKTTKGSDFTDVDLHIDATIAHPDAEIDGLAAAAAVAAISALENVPVHLDCMIVGNLTLGGKMRPVTAALQRVEAAARMGCRRAILPADLEGALVLEPETMKAIKITYAADLAAVLQVALDSPAATRKSIASRIGKALVRQ